MTARREIKTTAGLIRLNSHHVSPRSRTTMDERKDERPVSIAEATRPKPVYYEERRIGLRPLTNANKRHQLSAKELPKIAHSDGLHGDYLNTVESPRLPKGLASVSSDKQIPLPVVVEVKAEKFGYLC